MDLSPGTWAVPLRGRGLAGAKRLAFRGLGRGAWEGFNYLYRRGRPVANAPLRNTLLHGNKHLGQGGSWNQAGLPQLRGALLRPHKAADRMPEMRFLASSRRRSTSSAAAVSPSPPPPPVVAPRRAEDEEAEDENEEAEAEAEEEEAEAVVEAPLIVAATGEDEDEDRRGRRSRSGIRHDRGRRRRRSRHRGHRSRRRRRGRGRQTTFSPKSKTRKTMSPASSIPASPRTKLSFVD